MTAWRTSNNIQELVFHIGYKGFEFPRPVRRVFANTKWHNAWHSGFYGGGILPILERTKLAPVSR